MPVSPAFKLHVCALCRTLENACRCPSGIRSRKTHPSHIFSMARRPKGMPRAMGAGMISTTTLDPTTVQQVPARRSSPCLLPHRIPPACS